TEDSIVAEAAIPGVPEDRIDVTVDKDGTVRITGSVEDTKEDRSKRRYFMSSMASSFNYVFKLPQGIISEKEPMVEFDNGLLRLSFPKQAKEAPKKIKISKKREEKGVSQKTV
ncbi:MAG: Hsp20 family protein, partial [Actinobacteria bacterium]|nr:Hsp20 family protein [Actinomycetota bacterium]